MKTKICLFLISFFILGSCQQDNTLQIESQLKDAKKKQNIFKNIDQNWVLTVPELQPQTQSTINSWTEWRIFVAELKLKPKNAINAFQKKTKTLTKLSSDLDANVPTKFNQPAIKSRISVLKTQLRSLELYINLQDIPDKKVIALFPEINAALSSLTLQFEEIIRKEQIPIEQGESDLIRILDTTRAIPNIPKNLPPYE